jgi:hypothetical protein
LLQLSTVFITRIQPGRDIKYPDGCGGAGGVRKGSSTRGPIQPLKPRIMNITNGRAKLGFIDLVMFIDAILIVSINWLGSPGMAYSARPTREVSK